MIGYDHIVVCSRGPMAKPGPGLEGRMMASFELTCDLSFLFPYLNAVADQAALCETPPLVRFVFEERYCVLYARMCIITPFDDHIQAREFIHRLVAYLNRIDKDKETIRPNPRVLKRTSVPDILKLVPKTNCGACGFPTCMAFAAQLSRQEILPDRCPHIGRPLNEQVTYPVYDGDGHVLTTVTLGIDSAKQQEKQAPGGGDGKSRVSSGTTASVDESIPPLTGRETEILKLIGLGMTNGEMADRLHISPHTVKSHVINIFNKLGVNDRTQAAVWAARKSLI